MSRTEQTDDSPDPDAERVLRQTLQAMAGGPTRAQTPTQRPTKAPRGSDLRWWVLIGVLALLTGMVLGVGSLWLF